MTSPVLTQIHHNNPPVRSTTMGSTGRKTSIRGQLYGTYDSLFWLNREADVTSDVLKLKSILEPPKKRPHETTETGGAVCARGTNSARALPFSRDDFPATLLSERKKPRNFGPSNRHVRDGNILDAEDDNNNNNNSNNNNKEANPKADIDLAHLNKINNKNSRKPDGDKGTQVTVHGQQIHGLLTNESNSIPTQANQRPMIFTNGENVNLEHYLHSFIECPLEKARAEKVLRGMHYSPSNTLIVASINCFSRKKKRHFFQDALYLCTVFAKEMEMSLSSFLRVRGWLVSNHQGVVKISYRRVGDCLRLLGTEAALNYFRVSTIIDRLFRVLNSRNIFPEMPFEDRKTTQTNTPGHHLDTESEDKDEMEDSNSDSNNRPKYENLFEERSHKVLLPSHQQVHLVDFHHKGSSFGKLVTYQQTLQLGLNAVKCSFTKALHNTYSHDDEFFEKLFSVIFFRCSQRRMMLEGKTVESQYCRLLIFHLLSSTFLVSKEYRIFLWSAKTNRL